MDTLRLIPLECGRLTSDRGSVVEGAAGKATLPIPSWLVVHPTGRSLVFDTGLHADLQTDTSRIGSMNAMFDVHFSPGEEVAARLEAAEVDPASVEMMVFSHLHFDHCGGTALIPNARIVVQSAEWKAAHIPKLIEHDVYNPDDFELGHDVLQIEGEHDVFGDGSVLCIPTPGHTAGHQSLRVNLESGPVVLTGDCVYWQQVLDEMLLPPFGFDRDLQLESMRHLRSLRDDHGCTLLYGHDADQWESLPKDASGLS